MSLNEIALFIVALGSSPLLVSLVRKVAESVFGKKAREQNLIDKLAGENANMYSELRKLREQLRQMSEHAAQLRVQMVEKGLEPPNYPQENHK